ncbi:MAG: DUF4118 domain-containing protein [Anaerolineae bacterium]|nr:DUF4118 domain-containing protein [Anaerolineae bacterium]
MKKFRLSITPELLSQCAWAVLLATATTALLLLIGREAIGDAVIPLLYLVPVIWSTARWGQGPGLCAAVSATLMFDYFFVPPFHTFAVANPEGWLVLAIFTFVAVVLVGRLQSSLSKAQTAERDAILTYELSTALAGLRTPEAVTDVAARHLQQMFQAALVRVVAYPAEPRPFSQAANGAADGATQARPDRIIPLQGAQCLMGEIHIWRGHGWLPPEDSRLLRNLVAQMASALERARSDEAEAYPQTLTVAVAG